MHGRRYSPCCRHAPDVLTHIITHSMWCDSHDCWISLCRLCLAAGTMVSPICALPFCCVPDFQEAAAGAGGSFGAAGD